MAARRCVAQQAHARRQRTPDAQPTAGLIAKRISADLVGNLGAVRDHAEVLSIGAVAINRGQKTLARAA